MTAGATASGASRGLTGAERALARSVFGDAIDYDAVEIRNRKWAFFQPARVVMAPMGHLHFNPRGGLYCDDFCEAPIRLQALFIHEMTHVWQAQKGGRFYLPLMRHPFCRYAYRFVPGKPFDAYGLEQQAEIVRHAFMLRQGATILGAPPLSQYEGLLSVFR